MTQKLIIASLFLIFVGESKAQSNSTASLSTATSALSASKPTLNAKLDANLLGRNIDDALFKSTYSITQLVAQLNLNYNSWLSFYMQPEVVWISSNSQSLYTDEGKSSGGIYLDEASMIMKPLADWEFKAGSLIAMLNPVSTIISNTNSFLGLSQQYEAKFDQLKLTVYAQQAIPSSGSVTRGLISEAQPNAYFLNQTIKASLDLPQLKSIVTTAVTHFEWANLSGNIASESFFSGNDPRSFEGIGKSNRFRIGFQGFESAASWQIEWRQNFITKLTGSYIYNSEATEDRNSGYIAKLEATYSLKNFSITPYFSILRMGADVTPAAYNSTPRRYHNREGIILGAKLQLLQEKIALLGTYFQGRKILNNPYMADREMYTLMVETKHDIL